MPLMVIVFADQAAVTPVGKPVTVPIPVAPVVVWVIGDIVVLKQTVGDDDAGETELACLTVMIPDALLFPQLPVKLTVYGKDPETVGVPLMVKTFDVQVPVTPAGNPVTLAPVAPEVLNIMGVNAVFIHFV